MDYQRALADGHSPEDVMGELARRGVKMDYKRAIADGHDPMEVLKEMNSREGRTTAPAARPAPSKPTAPAASQAPARSNKWTNPLAPLGAAIGRKWDRFKEHPVAETLHTAGQVLAEPVQLAGEAVTGVANSLAGIVHGAQASTAARKQGQPIGQQVLAARHAAAQPTYEPALGNSWTGRAVGHVVGDVTNKAAQDLNLPGLPETVAAGGNVLGLAAIKPGIQAVRTATKLAPRAIATLGERGLPLTAKRAQYQAAQKFNALSQPLSPEHAMTQTTDVAAAQQLNQRIMAGRSPDEQATFTPGEQGMTRHGVNEVVRRSRSKDDLHAVVSELNDNKLVAGAREQVDRAIPGEPGEGARTIRDRIKAEAEALTGKAGEAGRQADAQAAPLAATDSPQTVGERIADTLSTARKPLQEAKRAAYKEVDDLGYEMDFPKYRGKVGELLDAAGTEADPMMTKVAGILKQTLDKARSTGGYDAIYKTINAYLGDLRGSSELGAKRATALLQEAKTALKADAEDMGEAARKGDVAVSGGRIIRPSAVKDEIAALEKRIADAQGKQAGIDYDGMEAKMKPPGYSFTGTGYKKGSAQNRKLITDEWNKQFPGQQPPTVSAVDPKLITDLTGRRDTLARQLTEAQPAEDFATKYQNATTLARQEAERYNRGAVEDVFKQGNEASGGRLPHEKVPARFATETGADDLARSLSTSTERDAKGKLVITPEGRAAAGNLMRDHFAEQAARMVDNPKKFAAWVNSAKVKPVLQKLGLYDEFSNISRAKQAVAQAQSTLEQFNKSTVGKLMELDPDKIVDWIHKQPDPAAAMREVKAFGKDNPQYQAGLQVAVRDWMMNSGEVTAEDMLGFNKTSLSKSKKLAVARTKRMLREVFDGKQMDTLSDFHETLRNLARNKTTPHGANSATSYLTTRDMGQIGYGVARDVSRHFGGQIVNSAANIVRHVMKGLVEEHNERIEQFVDQAALNPSDAKVLTDIIRQSQTRKGVNEATRKILAARLRGYAAAATVRGAAGQALQQPQSREWGTPDSTTEEPTE